MFKASENEVTQRSAVGVAVPLESPELDDGSGMVSINKDCEPFPGRFDCDGITFTWEYAVVSSVLL